MDAVVAGLEEARRNLLDMTLRNRLLSFREFSRSTAKIVDEIPQEIYHRLVLEGKHMEFDPDETGTAEIPAGGYVPEEEAIELTDDGYRCRLCEEDRPEFLDRTGLDDHVEAVHEKRIGDGEGVGQGVQELEGLWDLPGHESELGDRHTDKYLQTSHDETDLEKRLYHIDKRAEALIEDAGYNALHLCLGFLEWKEAPQATETRRAPLILVPVELARRGTQSAFKLRWNEEEVITNLSLQLKLEEQGIDLPDFEMPEEKTAIRAYLEDVEATVEHLDGWQVRPDIHLGFFNFTKFIMFRDLDQESWPEGLKPQDHPLVKSLLDPDATPEEPDPFPEDEIDERLSPTDVHHVKNADPSQIAVLEDVKNTRDLVVEGPPGTGKSQTIVNLIGELLAKGRTVLFVSEKMAALEVVKERLDEVGVGDFCVNLHSEESKKSKFLEELERLTKISGFDPEIPDETFEEVGERIGQLNAYAEALREPLGGIQRSPYALFGTKEDAVWHFEEQGRDFPYVDLVDVETLSGEQYRDLLTKLENLSSRLGAVQPIQENPWKTCRPGTVLPPEKAQINTDLTHALSTLDELRGALSGLRTAAGVENPRALEAVATALDASTLVRTAPEAPKTILSNEGWRELPSVADELIQKTKRYRTLKRDLDGRLQLEGLEESPSALREDFGHLWERLVEGQPIDRASGKQVSQVQTLVEDGLETASNLLAGLEQLAELAAVKPAAKLGDLDQTLEAAEVISHSQPTDPDVLSNPEWNEVPEPARDLIQNLDRFTELRDEADERFNLHALEEDPRTVRMSYEELATSFSRFFRPTWWKTRGQVKRFYQGERPSEPEATLSDLDKVIELQELESDLEGAESEGQRLFGSHWRGLETNPEKLHTFADWMVEFRAQLIRQRLEVRALELVRTGIPKSELRLAITQVRGHARDLEETTQELLTTIGTDETEEFGTSLEEISLEQAQTFLADLQTAVERWWEVDDQLTAAYTENVPTNREAVQEDLDKAQEFQDLRAGLEENHHAGETWFGPHWEGADSSPDTLQDFADWIIAFRGYIDQGVLTDRAIEVVSTGPSASEISESEESTKASMERLAERWTTILGQLETDAETVFGVPLDRAPLDAIEQQADLWKNTVEELPQWGQFQIVRSGLEDSPAAPILDLVNEDKLGPTDVIPCFKGNFADALLSVGFQDRAALAEFDHEVHEGRIDSFRTLDEETLKLHRKRVVRKLVENLPTLIGGASQGSQTGLLLHEFGKSRRHLPIRKLLTEAGDVIQELKPCFMMSPLSVSKYLEPGSLKFDVVVFDEASQVRPEDALGTLLRGTQLVVFGDSNQLPPTSFFDHVVEHRETEDPTSQRVTESESILNLARSKFPLRRLQWHYRSLHESLIAVSNKAFYENDLYIYPSPHQDDEALGLKLRHLPETSYDRGGSRKNKGEARAVAEACVEHYRQHPEKSLGVGTFSSAQQEAIEEEILRLRKANPDIDNHFSREKHEHFFVKNLERIQGDERDVIFISVGYGYDENGGFSHNFGPLNQSDGWRRLNVLITRARERCVVFSNFTSDALQVDAGSPKALRILKTYLNFAETGDLGTPMQVREDADSPFEESVLRFLKREGIAAHPQVGSAGFRVDIGIVDPDREGSYLLGVECDGAPYHSTRVARARDRLRQLVLEARGWTIHRIWSTDWYRNREKAQERLLRAIEEARAKRPNSPAAATDGDDKPVRGSNDGGIELEIDDSGTATQGALDDLTEPYQVASGYGPVPLSDGSPHRIAQAVEEVVRQEGPIHEEVLQVRLREESDVNRIGKHIRRSIQESVDHAVRSGMVERRGVFLWPPELTEVPVRKRGGSVSPDIEEIPEEELATAIELVLQYQFSTPEDEVPAAVAQMIGFGRTSKKTSERISELVDALLKEGAIERTHRGHLKKPAS